MIDTRMPCLVATALMSSILLAVGVMSGHAMPADAQRPENLESVQLGRRTAERLCARCHATGRRGASPNPSAPRFARIAERYPDNNPAPELIDGVVLRHPGMPEFRLMEGETDGLVAYLRWISRKRHP